LHGSFETSVTQDLFWHISHLPSLIDIKDEARTWVIDGAKCRGIVYQKSSRLPFIVFGIIFCKPMFLGGVGFGHVISKLSFSLSN
jgi:hypothetical protein